jgi:prolyl-tRNA synthetase
MDEIGGQEVLMPSLHPADIWQATGAWDSVDILFKLISRTGKEYALGQSHEEVITPLAREMVRSYKNLPLALYQINWKFRDELRSKSGILRGREFEMKDMYSFHEDEKDFERFYEIVKKAYLRAYKKLGLVAKVTEASGGIFTDKISFEFMVATDAGEDDILYCSTCEFCVNTDIAEATENDKCPKCSKGKLRKARASEVGNVFDLGEKYTKDFELTFTTRDGKQAYPVMGCYGWGTTRTMGVLVEKFHDSKGIIWPESVAPFKVQLVSLEGTGARAGKIYQQLSEAGVEVLWDDREDISAGVKFADADLIGIPWRAVISKKTKGRVEVKRRHKKRSELVTVKELLSRLE